MSLPTIDFRQIRAQDGSQHSGFEELCSQLASLEPSPEGSTFSRKGRGADGGIECYRAMPNQSEIGWQAKYLFSWTDGLVRQLDDSVKTALERHPKLTTFVVCLPFDFPDSRCGRAKTAKEKWGAWKRKWEIAAQRRGRSLSISLWGRAELVGMLTSDSKLHVGRLLYWFGIDALSADWFADHFSKSRALLGSRYTPETNVDLPIRRDFLGLVRHSSLQIELDDWLVRLRTEGHSASRSIIMLMAAKFDPRAAMIQTKVDLLCATLAKIDVSSAEQIPLNDCLSALSGCWVSARDAMRWTWDGSVPDSRLARTEDPRRWAQSALQTFMDLLGEIEDALKSRRWLFTNARAVLITGPAGIGKSHLLADIVAHQIQTGAPAVLALGSVFRDDEPWHQLLLELDRPPGEQVRTFLGALDAAAQASNSRALVCIDALNERHGLDVWPARLAAFLKHAEAFPRVCIILSCRSTYVPFVVPYDIDEKQLYRVEHLGFADGGKATKAYLAMRKIVQHGAPGPLPEFRNPLFLKTCCDFLEKQGVSEFPRGLRGVTSLFAFYNQSVVHALNRRMQLDPRMKLVERAISGFAELLANANRGYLDISSATMFFESIRQSNGSIGLGLLRQLESEGLISVEPIRLEDGTCEELVRFTFERFSDYAIASHILLLHVDRERVKESIGPGTALHDFLFGSRHYEHAGVIEALAVQLSEQFHIELFDIPGALVNGDIVEAFKSSLLWREQGKFSDRTRELAESHLSDDEYKDLLVAISGESQNKFNALYTSAILKSLSMPERDQTWTTFLVSSGTEGAIESLIDWALTNGFDSIDETRAHLSAVMLTWFLTASHRQVRDRATKGLSCMLATRLEMAADLVRYFADVNDPYVSERLIAACYGAAMQGRSNGLPELSSAIFETVFSSGTPPVDALLRDHAYGIVEYAKFRGALPKKYSLLRAQPPYVSPWPVEFVTDDVIDSYKEHHPKGTFRDEIVGSVVNDGDFARYQLDHIVDDWSPASLGTVPLPSSTDVFNFWLDDFLEWGSKAQYVALKEAGRACARARGLSLWEKSAETESRDLALATFTSLLTEDQREDFRVRARDTLIFSSREQEPPQPARFNTGWSRRWVCKRAHDLGWTDERFAAFERSCGRTYDRHEHRIERIGKKYQWIALRELVARMADNLAYIGNSWDRRADGTADAGVRRTRLRDIDPSLLATKTHYDGWAQWSKTWWVPFHPKLRQVSPHERLAWLASDNDLINDRALIDVTNPIDGRRWLALWSFSSWRSWGVRGGQKELQRDTWYRLNCVVMEKKDVATFFRTFANTKFVDPHGIPKIDLHGDFHLGEYPWHPELKHTKEWIPFMGRGRKFSINVLPTVANYLCESGGYDYSIDRTISIEIPAPWLADEMGLHLTSGRSPAYTDSLGTRRFFDPSVSEPGPAAALVDRDAFLATLERRGLSAVWVVGGEKSIHGGGDGGRGYGGRVVHTALYRLTAEGFVRQFHSEREHPSPAQLKEFLGDDA